MATRSNLDWHCVNCTLKNKAENVFCEICYAAKGVPASQSVAIDDRTKQQSQYTNNKISKPSSQPTTQNTSNRFPFNKQKKNSNTRNHQKKIEIRMCNDYGTVNKNGCKFGQLNKDPSKDCLNIHIENRYPDDIDYQNDKYPLVNILKLTEFNTMRLANEWYKNKNINIRNLGIYLHEAVKGYNDAEFSGSFVRTSPKNDKNNDDEKKQSNSIDEISQKMGYVKFGVYSRMFHECVCNYLMGKIPKHREKEFSKLWQKEDYVESIIKQTKGWQSATNGKNAMSICNKLEYIRKKTNHIVHGCVKYGEKACTRYLEYNQQILVYLHDIAKWLNDDIIKQKYTPKPLDDQKQNMTNNNDANRPYRNNSGGSIRGQGRSASHDNNNNYNREINNRNINKKQQKLKRWLKDTVSLEQYFDVLVDNGFDKMESMKMLTMNELNLLGIIEHEHRIRLLKCIDALKK